jgi:hypothetical protein
VPPTLIHFLARHPAISNLSIIPPPGGPWRTNQIITPLTLSLSILDGPLSHLLPVLQSHCKPQHLSCLYISLQAHDLSPDYITSVLQCVSYCDSIRYLVLSLPNGHSSAAMMCLSGAHSMVRIKHLVIDYSDGSVSVPGAAGDPLVCVIVTALFNTNGGHRHYPRHGFELFLESSVLLCEVTRLLLLGIFSTLCVALQRAMLNWLWICMSHQVRTARNQSFSHSLLTFMHSVTQRRTE